MVELRVVDPISWGLVGCGCDGLVDYGMYDTSGIDLLPQIVISSRSMIPLREAYLEHIDDCSSIMWSTQRN